jgi:hypothetical protein
MTAMATEHDHLAQALRHIARAEEMVTEQRDLIARMASTGMTPGWPSSCYRPCRAPCIGCMSIAR